MPLSKIKIEVCFALCNTDCSAALVVWPYECHIIIIIIIIITIIITICRFRIENINASLYTSQNNVDTV